MVARIYEIPCASLCWGRGVWHKVTWHKVTRHKVGSDTKTFLGSEECPAATFYCFLQRFWNKNMFSV